MRKLNKVPLKAKHRWSRTLALLGVITIMGSTFLSMTSSMSSFTITAFADNPKSKESKKQQKTDAKTQKHIQDNTSSNSISDESSTFNDLLNKVWGNQPLTSSEKSKYLSIINKLDLSSAHLSSNALAQIKEGKPYNQPNVKNEIVNAFSKYQSKQYSNSKVGTAGSNGNKDSGNSNPLANVAYDMVKNGESNPLTKQIVRQFPTAGNAGVFLNQANSLLGISSNSSYTSSLISLFDAKSDGSTSSREEEEHGSSDVGGLDGYKNGVMNKIYGWWDDAKGSSNSDIQYRDLQDSKLQNESAAASYMSGLQQLGLIKAFGNMGIDDSLNSAGRRLFGIVLMLGNMANSVVNWMFNMIAYLANTVNPVKWMTGGRLANQNPAEATKAPLSPYQAEGETPTMFQRVGYMFYMLFYYAQKLGMMGAALSLGVGLALGVLGWRLSGKIQKGNGILATITRFFLRSLLILGLPLVLSAFLSTVMSGVASSFGNHRASSADYAIYSNMVDFEDWVQDSRLDLPPAVTNDDLNNRMGSDDDNSLSRTQYGTAGGQLVNTPYVSNDGVASHQLILDINGLSAGVPAARQMIEQGDDGNSFQNPLDANGLNSDIDASVAAQQRSDLINKWFDSDTYTSSDWTSFVKAQLATSGAGNGDHVQNILSDPKNNYATNGTLYSQGRGAPFITANPQNATGTARGTSSSGQQEDITDSNGGFSTLSMGTVLSSRFGDSSFTFVSSNKLANSFTGISYRSAVFAGTGLVATGNYVLCIGLIWSSAIIGFFFALAALKAIVWCVPRLLGYLLAAATGSFKAACKSITITVGLVIELELTALLYLLFQELLVSFSQIMNVLLQSSARNHLFGGGANSPTVINNNNVLSNILSVIPNVKHLSRSIVVLGGSNNPSVVYGMSNLVLGLLLLWVAWSMAKIRTRIVNIFTSLATGFFDSVFQVVDNSLGGASAFQANAYTSSMNEGTGDLNTAEGAGGGGGDAQSKLAGYAKQALGQDVSGDQMDVNHDSTELGENDVPSTIPGDNGTGAGSQPYRPVASGPTFGSSAGNYLKQTDDDGGTAQNQNPDDKQPDGPGSYFSAADGSQGGGGATGPGGDGSGASNASGSGGSGGGGKMVSNSAVLPNVSPNTGDGLHIGDNRNVAGHRIYTRPAGWMKPEYYGGDGVKAQPFNTIGGLMHALGGSGHGGILSNFMQALGNPNGLGGLFKGLTGQGNDSIADAQKLNQMMGGSGTNTGEIDKLAGMQNLGKLFNNGFGQIGDAVETAGNNNIDGGETIPMDSDAVNDDGTFGTNPEGVDSDPSTWFSSAQADNGQYAWTDPTQSNDGTDAPLWTSADDSDSPAYPWNQNSEYAGPDNRMGNDSPDNRMGNDSSDSPVLNGGDGFSYSAPSTGDASLIDNALNYSMTNPSIIDSDGAMVMNASRSGQTPTMTDGHLGGLGHAVQSHQQGFIHGHGAPLTDSQIQRNVAENQAAFRTARDNALKPSNSNNRAIQRQYRTAQANFSRAGQQAVNIGLSRPLQGSALRFMSSGSTQRPTMRQSLQLMSNLHQAQTQFTNAMAQGKNMAPYAANCKAALSNVSKAGFDVNKFTDPSISTQAIAEMKQPLLKYFNNNGGNPDAPSPLPPTPPTPTPTAIPKG